ncbi:GNAT family N-acetyltransferase [Pseudoalteromonas apostichopi]|uniref:GNAT family N-acetyltransferase n=1 Tax=Pseudoalteromonas apostichopi TaxID=3035452 RepID=UPI002572CF19|nr:GNAT family N-acetyltransferase [Pseudoalteromonas sp. FE4]
MEVKLVQNLDEISILRIAEIHKLNYPDDHLTSHFTLPLLCDYYSNIAELSDYSIVAYYGNEIVGFAFLGRTFESVLPRLVKNNKNKIFNFALQKPAIVFKFFLNKAFSGVYHLDSASNIRLISITSDRKYSKLRIGTTIVAKLEELQAQYKLDVGLSVRASNIKAVNFYIKNGYILEGFSKGKLFMVNKNA